MKGLGDHHLTFCKEGENTGSLVVVRELAGEPREVGQLVGGRSRAATWGSEQFLTKSALPNPRPSGSALLCHTQEE